LAAGAVSGKSDRLRFSRALDRSNSRTIGCVLTCRNKSTDYEYTTGFRFRVKA
jgi:hypothetical protein